MHVYALAISKTWTLQPPFLSHYAYVLAIEERRKRDITDPLSVDRQFSSTQAGSPITKVQNHKAENSSAQYKQCKPTV
jgi:hypothetical protein